MKSLVGQLVEHKQTGNLYTILAVEYTKDSDGVSVWVALMTRYLGDGSILSEVNFHRYYKLTENSRKAMER